MLNPGGPVGPITLTAGQGRPLVDGNCGIDISRITQPDPNGHAESLGASDAGVGQPPEASSSGLKW